MSRAFFMLCFTLFAFRHLSDILGSNHFLVNQFLGKLIFFLNLLRKKGSKVAKIIRTLCQIKIGPTRISVLKAMLIEKIYLLASLIRVVEFYNKTCQNE